MVAALVLRRCPNSASDDSADDVLAEVDAFEAALFCERVIMRDTCFRSVMWVPPLLQPPAWWRTFLRFSASGLTGVTSMVKSGVTEHSWLLVSVGCEASARGITAYSEGGGNNEDKFLTQVVSCTRSPCGNSLCNWLCGCLLSFLSFFRTKMS